MARLSSFFISIIFISLAFGVQAQVIPDSTNVADSISAGDTMVVSPTSVTGKINTAESVENADSIAAASETFSVNIYLDYGKLLTYPFGFEKKLEGGLYLRFNNKWAIGGEAGKAFINPLRPFDNGDAEAEGIYYGGFIQYFVHLDAFNSLFLGFGYNQGTFDDIITYTITSDYYGETTHVLERTDMKASWATVRLGSEKRLNSLISIGGVMEVRFKTNFEHPEILDPVAIPGYGKSSSKVTPAVNLYLKFSF